MGNVLRKSKSTKEINFIRSDADIKSLFIVLLVALIVFLIPVFFRAFSLDGNAIGAESYLNIRLARTIAEERRIPSYDYLSYGGRNFNYNIGWPIILSILYVVSPSNIHVLSMLLSIFFALVALIFLYLILHKLKFSKLQRIIMIFILILTPAFIYVSNISSPIIVTIALALISFYLINSSKKYYKILSLLVLFLIPIFSFIFGILVLFILTLYILVVDRSKLKFLVFALIVMASVYVYYLFSFGLMEPREFEASDTKLANYFSELGANFGLSFFASVLSLFGLYRLKIQNNIKIFLYLLLFLMILLSVFYVNTLFYFSIIVALLAGIGLNNLIKDKWESEIIRKATIVILAIGLIFSSISYVSRAVEFQPNYFLLESIDFLKNNLDSEDTVAAHYKLGHFITYAGSRNIMDDYFIYAPKLNKRFSDMEQFFFANDSETVNKFIDDYSVDYIMLDDNTYYFLYKSKVKNIYLPYYLNNDKRFKIVFENEGVTIWKVFR